MNWDTSLVTYQHYLESTSLLDEKTKEEFMIDFSEIFTLYQEFETINLEHMHLELPLVMLTCDFSYSICTA